MVDSGSFWGKVGQLPPNHAMSDVNGSKPIYYNSIFRHGVDDKRRVQIPAKWRPADPDIEFTLIRWPNGNLTDACLLVLPPEVWRLLAEKIMSMPFADPQAQVLRRLLGKKSAQVSLDRSGRICLPEDMAQAAGIEKEAVFVGLVDRFQIWSSARHEQVEREDEESSAAAFKLLS